MASSSPRHLNTLIAKIPGVGALFANMLPIAGAAVAIEIVGKLIAKHDELREKLEAAALSSVKFNLGLSEQSNKLKETTLRLQDQIAGLEHKPQTNYLKEAILENADAMDQWATRSISDYSKTSVALGNYIGLINMIKNSFLNFDDPSGSMIKMADAATRNKVEMQAVAEATGNLAEAKPGTDDYASALALLIRHEKDLVEVTKTAMAAAKLYGSAGQDALLQLTQLYQTSTAAVKKLTDEQVNGALRIKAAGLHQSVSNLEPLKQEAALFKIVEGEAAKASSALMAHQDAVAKLTETKSGGSDNLAAEQAYNNAVYGDALDNAERLKGIATNLYNKEYAANADNKEKQKELTANYNAQITALNRNEAVALDALNQVTLEQYIAAEQKKIQATEKEAQHRTKIAQETAKFDEQMIKQEIAAGQEAINSAVAHETMTWKQAQTAKIALIERESAAKNAAMLGETTFQEGQLQAQINAAKTAADAELALNGGNKTDPRYIAYLAQVNLLTQQQIQLVRQLQNARQLEGAQSAAAIKKETDAMSPLQQRMKQVQAQFNSSFAQMVVSGKNFGQSMQQMGAQLAQELIQYEMKKLEKYLWCDLQDLLHHQAIGTTKKAIDAANAAATVTTATTASAAIIAADKLQQIAAAGLAGANMMASFSAAPWPIDMGAPAAATSAFAGALAYETGGKIPGSNGAVPIIGHAGETVIQKSLTDRVERAESFGGGKSGGNHTFNYAPQVHAMDAEGVDRVLSKHSTIFSRHITSAIRKMNK